jgi:tetratricopeptide (TPR) repeat protein
MFDAFQTTLISAARERAAAGVWAEVSTLLAPHVESIGISGELTVLYGEALTRLGREREAYDWLRSAEPELAANDDRGHHRRAVNLLGVASFAIGKLDEANRAFSWALELATQADDVLLLARASNNLGTIANLQSQYEGALSHYRLALPSYQRLGQRRGLAETYHNMAITFRDLGDLEQADEQECRAIEYAADGIAPRVSAMGRVGRAEVALRRGDAQLAEMTARLAAEELERLGDPLNEADAHRLVGVACGAQQRYLDALEAFDRALTIARARGHALNEAETLRDRVQVHVRQGETTLAVADAKAAIAIFTKLGAVAEREALERRLEQLG